MKILRPLIEKYCYYKESQPKNKTKQINIKCCNYINKKMLSIQIIVKK